MKIGLVCPYDMIGHAGGVQQIVTHQAEELRKRGHKVKIITPRPLRTQHDIPEGYILLGSSTKIKAGLATAGDVGIEFDGKEIEEVLGREKFDVIHFHEPWLPHLSRQIIQRSNSAHVSTFHANMTDSTAGKSILNLTSPYWRVIMNKTHVFTAVSEAASSGLLNKGSKNQALKHLRYIPNGIDLKRYQAKPSNSDHRPNNKTIFYIGRLEGRKGLKYLIKAYAVLAERRDDVQLFIAGKGVDENKLRNYVRDNNIPRVTFLGYINDDEKINHLHRADVFCAPAHRGESFGIVLIEAMAAGTPIIAGDNHGYSSTMKGTGALSLVNPLDIDDFARRLELMLYDEELRNVWKKWAKTYVKAFDWAPIISQYEEAYKDAIRINKAQIAKDKHGKQPKLKAAIRRFSLRRQS